MPSQSEQAAAASRVWETDQARLDKARHDLDKALTEHAAVAAQINELTQDLRRASTRVRSLERRYVQVAAEVYSKRGGSQ